MTTNSYHTRINAHKLSLGMVRYSDGKTDTYHKEDVIWRLVVSNLYGSEKLAAINVTISDLVTIKSFCDQAMDTLRSDGNRSEDTP